MSEDPQPPKAVHPGGGTYIAGDVYTGGGDFVARDKYEIHLPSLKDARARRDQLILLHKVRQFWVEGVLEKSLHQAVLLELGKETRPDLIPHPWETVVELPNQQPASVPPQTPIADLFDQAGRSLLILGEPGSGKTITLLELARALLDRAEKDPAQPIPVVLNLSTWGERRSSFAEWVVEELNSKYQIPKKLGQAWLVDFDLLLLLDGLDEVRREHREACVQALNRFGHEHGLSGIAVCSRVAEYAALKTRLKMGGAVSLQPLSAGQINVYFDSVGDALTGLREALGKDTALQELAHTPLMLSVMGLAYQDLPVNALEEEIDSLEGRRQHIFNTYIRRMFGRTPERRISQEKMVRWLSWLASRQQSLRQTVFLIENLQPAWLDKPWQIWVYTLLSRAMGGLILGMGLIFAGSGNLAYRVAVLLIGVTGGTIAGILTAWRFTRKKIPEELASTGKSSWDRLPVIGLAIGLVVGGVMGVLTFVSLFFIVYQETLADELLIYRLLGSFFAGILGAILAAILMGGLSGFLFELIFGRRLKRQTLLSDIRTVDALRWSWREAFKSSPRGAWFGAILGPILGVPLGLVFANEPIDAIILVPMSCCLAGFFAGGFGLLIGGVIGGMRGVSVPHKQVPNQGIWLTVKNSILVGGIIIVPVGLLNNVLSLPDTILEGLINFRLGISIGLITVMFFGILDFIQHFVLRTLLWGFGNFPFQIVPFLNHAAALIFLRKVGGGYIFVHRLLQEHFAAMDVEAFLKETHG